MFYNFVRIHQALRITPAMAAGISAHVWEIADIVKNVEELENNAKDDSNGPGSWVLGAELRKR
jgi:hypothetical protein